MNRPVPQLGQECGPDYPLEIRLGAYREGVVVKEELFTAEKSESGELAGLLAVLSRLKVGWPLVITPLSEHVAFGLLNLPNWRARQFALVAYPDQWAALSRALKPHHFTVEQGYTVVLSQPEAQEAELAELLGCA